MSFVIFKQRFKVGTHKEKYARKADPVIVTVTLRAKERSGPVTLSMVGQIGRHSYGQVGIPRLDKTLVPIGVVRKMRKYWETYHLNDMNAGCVHQKKAKWGQRLITSGPHKGKYTGHVYPEEGGCLCKPCRVCGYAYGTAWLYEKIPREVVKEIMAWGEQLPHLNCYYGEHDYKIRHNKFFSPHVSVWNTPLDTGNLEGVWLPYNRPW